MKVEGTEDSKIIESVSAAKDSKLVFNDQINACTLQDGAMYHIEPGSFHVHKARAGNNPQSGPPFIRFKAIMEGAAGRVHTVMVETFLTSLVAVFYPVPEPVAEDETDDEAKPE